MSESETRAQEMQGEGILQKMRGQVKSVWGEITDDDFDKAEGNMDKLVGTIKEKTGQAEEAIRERIESLSKKGDAA